MSPLVVAAAGLVLVGLHGLLALTHRKKRILAANILGSGLFVLLVALSRDETGAIEVVPQAMVLTGIVVSFAATALVLTLVRSIESDSDESR